MTVPRGGPALLRCYCCFRPSATCSTCVPLSATNLESPVYALARVSRRRHWNCTFRERVSTVSFLAHAYTFKDLLDERTLNRVFLALKSEYQGLVDMGLVDADGQQVGYVGPYKLKGVDYAGKPWLRDTEIKGRYLSNVLGYRGYPHLVRAVHRLEENGVSWTLRVAAIDTLRIQQVVSTVGPEHDTDVFLVDTEGVLQTDSNLFGKGCRKNCPWICSRPLHETGGAPHYRPQGQAAHGGLVHTGGHGFHAAGRQAHRRRHPPLAGPAHGIAAVILCGGIALISRVRIHRAAALSTVAGPAMNAVAALPRAMAPPVLSSIPGYRGVA